jgi:Outer membrane protein beta-barrel domain
MKKRILFVFGLVLLLNTSVFAQRIDKLRYLPTFDKHRVHFGFYLGINQKSFKIDYKLPNTLINVKDETGFNIGLVSDLRIFDNLNLRLEPGISHNVKTLYFTNILTARDSVREASNTYLHVPLLLKFSANRINNFRPYLLAGVSYDFNFSSNQDSSEDNSQRVFRMSKNNFMYEVGFGIDFYFFFFKFSPSIRGVFAMNNELVRDADPNSQWTAPINYLGTRGIFINLSFE